MKKRYIIIIVIFAVVFLSYLQIRDKNGDYAPPAGGISSVEIGDTIFEVEVVDTTQERTKGLSGRESLSADEGMLFVFEKSDIYPFWMKDMNFPIDIIWINEDLKVVYIKENATPGSFPKIFTPDNSALYVLEVSAGITTDKKIKIGDDVILNISNVY